MTEVPSDFQSIGEILYVGWEIANCCFDPMGRINSAAHENATVLVERSQQGRLWTVREYDGDGAVAVEQLSLTAVMNLTGPVARIGRGHVDIVPANLSGS